MERATRAPVPAPTRIAGLAAVVVAGSAMSIIDSTAVNIALEELGRDMGAPLSQVQWVATGYLLALGAIIPVAGWAARRFGMRRVWLASLAGFTIGSALCALAWSVPVLVAFRVVQGLSGGMLVPVGQMMLARAAGPGRMGRVMSAVGVPLVLAPVLGPVVGGALLEAAGWRWIFLVNVPLGAAAALLAMRHLPPDRPEGAAGRLDRVGLALLVTGLPLVIAGISETGREGGLTPRALLPLAGGIVLVGAFAAHARRVPRPLLDVRLLGDRVFGAAALTTFAAGAALFGAIILLPLYFQVARHTDPLTTGLLMAPQGLGAAIALPIAGRLSDRLGGGPVTLAGIAVLAAGTLPFTILGPGTSFAETSLALVMRGLGLGLTMTPAMTAAYAALRRDQVPDASPQLNVAQRVGGSLGGALMAVVLQHHLAASGGGAAAQAGAFASAYRWVFGLTAAALLPAFLLAVRDRRRRAWEAEQAGAGCPGDVAAA